MLSTFSTNIVFNIEIYPSIHGNLKEHLKIIIRNLIIETDILPKNLDSQRDKISKQISINNENIEKANNKTNY